MADLLNTNTILAPVAPALPFAPVEYDRKYQDDLSNILRLYFSLQDSALSTLFSSVGNRYLRSVYGTFQSTATQTASAINTATVMTLNQTDASNDVSVASSSRITVVNAGTYNLQWSGQFQNTDTAIQTVYVWLKQTSSGTSTDVVGSARRISIPARKSVAAGDEAYVVLGWNEVVTLQATDYVEIWWSTTSTAVSLVPLPAATGPVRPTTASVLASLTFVSAPLT